MDRFTKIRFIIVFILISFSYIHYFYRSALIAFTSDPNAPVWQGYALAVALFAVAFVQSLFLHQYFNVAYVSGMRLRSAIVSSIYRKVCKNLLQE